MDHPVVALAAASANLQRSRLNRVDAQIYSENFPTGGMAGGFLTAETTVQLAELEKSDEVVSSVSVKIEGFPKGVPRENTDPKLRVFCVEVCFEGVYSWEKRPSSKTIGNPDLAHALGRPMYALAVSEVRAIAGKMGFTGIKTAPDLPRASDPDTFRKVPTPLRRTSSSTQDVTDKLAAKSRKTRAISTKAK